MFVFYFSIYFVWGWWECFDNLHVAGTGTHQQSYSGNNGLADGGAGRLCHVRGDEVLQLVNYGVNCKVWLLMESINIIASIWILIKMSFSYEEIATGQVYLRCHTGPMNLGSVYIYNFYMRLKQKGSKFKQLSCLSEC